LVFGFDKCYLNSPTSFLFFKDRQEEGRPRKSKRTKKILKNSAPQVRKRVLAMCDPDGEPSDDDNHDSDEAHGDGEDECGDVEAAAAMRWSLPKNMVGNILDYMPFL
jgi:hypothetical protein